MANGHIHRSLPQRGRYALVSAMLLLAESQVHPWSDSVKMAFSQHRSGGTTTYRVAVGYGDNGLRPNQPLRCCAVGELAVRVGVKEPYFESSKKSATLSWPRITSNSNPDVSRSE